MSLLSNIEEPPLVAAATTAAATPSCRVHALSPEDQKEVLTFLSACSLSSVVLNGWIREYDLVSPFHRGTFYGCRNAGEQLEGVALIGHSTLFEARTEAALAALARYIRKCPRPYMMMGERNEVERFWQYYAEGAESPRHICQTILLERKLSGAVGEPVHELRLAKLSDLDLIVPVNAQIIYADHGVNPLKRDPEGFRRRCASRIEQGHTWVCVENNLLLFKVDIAAETPKAIYMEGVYVAPPMRGIGYGMRCLAQLERMWQGRTASIYCLVNESDGRARAFYQKAGYNVYSYHSTIFLELKSSKSSLAA